MKISDVEGERSFTILASLKEVIERLAKNEYLCKIYDKSGISPDMDKKAVQELVSNRVLTNLPDLMKYAKEDLTEYFSTLKNITPQEYIDGLTTGTLIKDISDMFSDTDFMGFFQLYQTQNSENAG